MTFGASRDLRRGVKSEGEDTHREPLRGPGVQEVVEEVVDVMKEGDALQRKNHRGCLSRFVVCPERGSRTAQVVQFWDLLTSFLLIACAYLIPFSLALPTVADLHVFRFNSVVDVCFTLDVALQFLTAYRKPEHIDSDTLWEKDPQKIARRYCAIPFSQRGEAGWFWLDALSVLPCWVQCFVSPQYKRSIQAVRSCRLIRMLRLSRLSLKLEQVQATTGLPFFMTDIMQFLFITTFVSHIAACMWVFVEEKYPVQNEQTAASWLAALKSAKGDSCTPDVEHDPLCVYTFAIYWAMMTLTSVGYGDIVPQHNIEYFIATLFMLFAGFVWAYVVGSVVSLLSLIDRGNAEFKQRMDEVNAISEHRHLSHGLRYKLREYMVESRNIGATHHQQALLEDNVSPGLQREVVLETPATQIFLKKVYWARGLEQDAVLEIMRFLQTFIYGFQESIPIKDRMILIREGLVAVNGRIFSRHEVIGENSILLASEFLADDPMPTTLSYVTVLALTKKALVSVCEMYPRADERLRTAQVRTAVWRGFVRAASMARSTAAMRSSTRVATNKMSAVVGFVRSHATPAATESVVRANELKALEMRLGQGQDELRYQLAETRELLASQKEMIRDIAEQMRSQEMIRDIAEQMRSQAPPRDAGPSPSPSFFQRSLMLISPKSSPRSPRSRS